MKQPYVSTLIEQDFSDEEKSLARDNISALSSADLGPYATKTWVSDNFLSDGDFRDFATHEEVASATSGKMDATEASAFYPRYSNPEGYIKNLFTAQYGISTFDEVKSAFLRGDEVFCDVAAQDDQHRMAFLAYANLYESDQNDQFIEFQYYKSNRYLDQDDTVIVYQIHEDDSWTTTERIAGNVSDWNATSGKTRILNKPDLSVYATEQWVLNKNYITSADVPPQIEYSAGPNIDIYNHIISTEKPRVEAGTNVSVNSVLDPQTRVITYTISAADTTYTAGSNVQISSGNVISATDTTYGLFNTTTDGLAPKASGTGDGAKFLRGDCTWQAPMTGVDGDANHPNYISVDSYGNLQYSKTKRLFWEFTFQEPSVELTATDITNGFVELVFPLGADGLGIMNNGNMVCMKGYSIEMGNSLNGRQLSFYILAHNGTSPRWLMDTGFTTYTESVVNNYDWKAFKAIGLCADRNASLVDAVLRVPLNTETAGQTFKIPGYVCVSVFGVASGD